MPPDPLRQRLTDPWNHTDLGLNLGGGVEFDAGTFRPVVGVRLELSVGESFVVFAALPFQLGN